MLLQYLHLSEQMLKKDMIKWTNLTFKEIETINGYLGFEAYRDENGFGVNVSYWKNLQALKIWKENTLHKKAQLLGKEKWYKNYKLRICIVERDYEK